MRTLASLVLRKGFAKASGHLIGRRQFIRQTTMATAAVLAGCSTNKPEISIIGGGLAGLSAAYELKKSGVPFTLYEASGRMGGRTFTIPDAVIEGSWVDFGAEYVDGNHEHLISLAHELNIPLIDLRTDTLPHWTYFFEGKHYNEEDVVNALTPYADAILKDIESLPADLHYKFGESYRELDEMSITEYLLKKDIKGWVGDFLKMAVTAEYAMEPDEQSAVNLLIMFATPIRYSEDYHIFHSDHEVLKVQGGTNSISNALAEKIGPSIQTDHTLREIHRMDGSGYELHFETSTGVKKVKSDMVILAVPLPVLRNIRKNFQFSPLKEQAIQETGFGNGAKVAMGFRSRPWRSQGFQGYTYTDVNGTVIWDSSQGVKTEQGSLTFIGAGDISEEFQKLSYADITAKWLSGAETIYPGVRENYNGQISKFCWATNPLAGGSYTSFRKGQWSRFTGIYGEPFENILFAGEHCSVDFQGYMNGAIETGQMEARRIIKMLTS